MREVAGQPARAVDRGHITQLLMKLFELWKLTTEEQLACLGLSTDNRSVLTRYRQKTGSISNSRDTMDRAGHLLAIHKNLRLLFPRNEELRYSWMKTRNRAFEGRTPVEAIQEFGLSGLLYVRSYLDRARGE